jgi:hypothetical protein
VKIPWKTIAVSELIAWVVARLSAVAARVILGALVGGAATVKGSCEFWEWDIQKPPEMRVSPQVVQRAFPRTYGEDEEIPWEK